jgi:hypothetical protein
VNEWLESVKGEHSNDGQIVQRLPDDQQSSLIHKAAIQKKTQEDFSDSNSSDESDVQENISLHTLDELKGLISSEAFISLCEALREWLDSSDNQKRGPISDQGNTSRKSSDSQGERVTTELDAPLTDEQSQPNLTDIVIAVASVIILLYRLMRTIGF